VQHAGRMRGKKQNVADGKRTQIIRLPFVPGLYQKMGSPNKLTRCSRIVIACLVSFFDTGRERMEVELFDTSHEDREATLPTGVSSLQHRSGDLAIWQGPLPVSHVLLLSPHSPRMLHSPRLSLTVRQRLRGGELNGYPNQVARVWRYS
jgi:hypothetical protein